MAEGNENYLQLNTRYFHYKVTLANWYGTDGREKYTHFMDVFVLI